MWLSKTLFYNLFLLSGVTDWTRKAGTLLRPNFELYHMPEFPRGAFKWTGARGDL